MKDKPCGICGKEFPRTAPHQRYCSDACRKIVKSNANRAYRTSDKGRAFYKAYRADPAVQEAKRAYGKMYYRTKVRTEEQIAKAREYHQAYMEARRKNRSAPKCRKCGGEFTKPRNKNGITYCSDKCRKLARKDHHARYTNKVAAMRAADPVLQEAYLNRKRRASRAYEAQKRQQATTV